MKRARNNYDNKDRVLCVTVPGKHQMYYQPAHTKARYWLIDVDFSGSIFAYFRDYGRNLYDRGFSLTLGELHQFDKYHNPKLARLMIRIPKQIDYLLREGLVNREDKKQFLESEKPDSVNCVGSNDIDYEHVA